MRVDAGGFSTDILAALLAPPSAGELVEASAESVRLARSKKNFGTMSISENQVRRSDTKPNEAGSDEENRQCV